MPPVTGRKVEPKILETKNLFQGPNSTPWIVFTRFFHFRFDKRFLHGSACFKSDAVFTHRDPLVSDNGPLGLLSKQLHADATIWSRIGSDVLSTLYQTFAYQTFVFSHTFPHKPFRKTNVAFLGFYYFFEKTRSVASQLCPSKSKKHTGGACVPMWTSNLLRHSLLFFSLTQLYNYTNCIVYIKKKFTVLQKKNSSDSTSIQITKLGPDSRKPPETASHHHFLAKFIRPGGWNLRE